MDSYYKLWQLFHYKLRHGLLQIATGITKGDKFIKNFDGYYKVRWLSQIATVHTYASGCRIPPSHSLINVIYFSQAHLDSHPPNFVLLCSNIYLSLLSYVPTSRKFAKWTFRSEPKLLINIMVLYSV